MEVFLYNSTVCRLCGEENDNGTLLYSDEENNQNLSDIINSYLPMRVSDDGELPRTICPGCTIQLEATVEFFNLVINGQKIIRDLYQRECEYKKNLSNTSNREASEIISENIVYEINTRDGIYQVEHPISLQVAGLDRPKRKRGRPPKKPKTPEELAQEAAAKQKQVLTPKTTIKDEEEPSGKRRRKTPTRFKEAVQGRELERIFIEEGVIDVEESDPEKKTDTEPAKPSVPQPEVIGHMEQSGELVVVVKGKGRGRPKGPMRQIQEECAVCGMKFSSVGRYMSHVAQHGPVSYRCSCDATFNTRLELDHHQEESGHSGRTVEPPQGVKNVQTNIVTKENKETEVVQKPAVDVEEHSILPRDLPDLSDVSRMETEPVSHEVIDVVGISNATEKITEPIIPETSIDAEPEEKVQTVKGKVKIKCNHCDKLFSNRQSKSLHIKAAHLGEKLFACTECPARFAYPQSLAVHRVSHRRTKHTKGYACDICGKVLNHPSSVVYHKQAEHASQKCVCGTCGKHFRHKQLLQRHQLVHSQVRPFSCKTCDATFKTKANLLNHQLLHSGVKKFSCDICKQRFAHKTSLTLHMRWHTGMKPFACNMCGKSFSQKGNLSEHERIHTGEKPYQCAVCPRRFTTSSQHRRHQRLHKSQATCLKCGKRMASRALWAIHIRRNECVPRTQTKIPERIKQPHKQISLLVTDKTQQSPQNVHKLEAEDEEETENEERVIYVAYDADDDDTAFHILDPDQAVKLEDSKVVTTCELYSGSSLLMPQQLEDLKVDVDSDLNEPDILDPDQLVLDGGSIPVTDEAGNPLHFTMQDGTKLAITSMDGKTLQVITQDGQTIPVEINGLNQEEEDIEVVDSDLMESQDSILQEKQLSDDEAPVTHYYTLV